MKNHALVRVVPLCLLLIAAFACKPKVDAGPVGTLPVVGKAPAWTLKDVNGQAVSSTDFKGKVVVLDFWATWCPPCRSEIPGYVKLQKKYADKGLVIVGVSLDQQGPPVVKAFMKNQGVDYTIVMGDDDITQAFGGVEAIPTTFLIDRDGNIRHRKVGAMETDEYERYIESVLNG